MKRLITAFALAIAALTFPLPKADASYSLNGYAFTYSTPVSCTATPTSPCSISYSTSSLGSSTAPSALLKFSSVSTGCSMTRNVGGYAGTSENPLQTFEVAEILFTIASTSNPGFTFTTSSSCSVSGTLYYN